MLPWEIVAAALFVARTCIDKTWRAYSWIMRLAGLESFATALVKTWFATAKTVVWLFVVMMLVLPFVVLVLQWGFTTGNALLATVLRFTYVLERASGSSEGVLDMLIGGKSRLSPLTCGNPQEMWCYLFPGCCA